MKNCNRLTFVVRILEGSNSGVYIESNAWMLV